MPAFAALLVALLLTLTGVERAPVAEPSAQTFSAVASVDEGSDWIAEPEDHICGLSSLRALSDPAKVDYPHLWDATPEIKRMKEEGIDPESAEGIRLQQEATDRILEACKEVKDELDHCSVWKAIRHEDGRKVPDVTKKVEAKF